MVSRKSKRQSIEFDYRKKGNLKTNWGQRLINQSNS